MLARAAPAWLLLALAAAGCATPSAPDCMIHSDCKSGMFCDRGKCRRECRLDVDCPSLQCEAQIGRCVVIDGSVPRDLTAADLRPPADLGRRADLAREDFAVEDLAAPAEDLAGPPPDLAGADLVPPPDFEKGRPRDLSEGPDLTAPRDLGVSPDFAPPPDLAAPSDFAIPRDLAQPRDFARPQDLARPLDLAPPRDLTPPPDLRPRLLGYGEPCAQDPECRALTVGLFAGEQICSSHPFAPGDKECAGDCNLGQPNQGCMPGDICAAGASCVRSDIGKNCVDGNSCRSAFCLGVPNQPQTNFCTRQCGTAADCPAGYSCSTVPPNPGRYCINLDTTPPCQNHAQCWYSTYCNGGRCLGECRSAADCPVDHVCQLVGGVRLCVPPGAGRLGNGATCNTPDDCRSSLCGDSKCLAECRVTASQGQWCPGGYGCNAVADQNNQYYLVCLRAGLGSIGAACQSNLDCASGLCAGNLCTRFCNDAPCPGILPTCALLGVNVAGLDLKSCRK